MCFCLKNSPLKELNAVILFPLTLNSFFYFNKTTSSLPLSLTISSLNLFNISYLCCRYLEERHRLDSEFARAQDDVARLKLEYQKALDRFCQDRLKYLEVQGEFWYADC